MNSRLWLMLAAVCCAIHPAARSEDQVTITVSLDGDFGEYTLIGQSSIFTTRTSGLTTGGLDGIQSPGASIGYTEFFPEDELSNYLKFGYFGRVIHPYDPNDPGSDPNDPNLVMPHGVSLIVAFRSGEGAGATISDYFSFTEAELVQAFDEFDSPQFFDFLFTVIGADETTGDIGLPGFPREGETLDLVAFIGGPNGHVGVKIGELTFTIIRTSNQPGDTDGDGSVGLTDLLNVLSSFGLCQGIPGFIPGADLNGNGCVDLEDLLTVLSHFGS